MEDSSKPAGQNAESSISQTVGETYIRTNVGCGSLILLMLLCVFAPIGLKDTGVMEKINPVIRLVFDVAVSQAYPIYRDGAISGVIGAKEGLDKVPPVPEHLTNPSSIPKNVEPTKQTATNGTKGSTDAVSTPTPIPQPLEKSAESLAAAQAWLGVDTKTNQPKWVDLTEVRSLVNLAFKTNPTGDLLATKVDTLLKPCEVFEANILKLTKDNAKKQAGVAEYLAKCNPRIRMAYHVSRFAKLMEFEGKQVPATSEMLLDGVIVQVVEKSGKSTKVINDTDVFTITALPDNAYGKYLTPIRVKLTGKQMNTLLSKTKWKSTWLEAISAKHMYEISVPGGTGSITPIKIPEPTNPLK